MDEFITKLIEQAPTVGVLVLVCVWQARNQQTLIDTLIDLIKRCDCDEDEPAPTA